MRKRLDATSENKYGDDQQAMNMHEAPKLNKNNDKQCDTTMRNTNNATNNANATNATIKISMMDYKRLMMGLVDAAKLMETGALEIAGDAGALLQMTGLFDQFLRRFPIVTARKPWAKIADADDND